MKKYIIIALIIAAVVIACVIGSYTIALGAFLFKVMLGLVAIIIFSIGIVIGRFFPYKSKSEKQILNG